MITTLRIFNSAFYLNFSGIALFMIWGGYCMLLGRSAATNDTAGAAVGKNILLFLILLRSAGYGGLEECGAPPTQKFLPSSASPAFVGKRTFFFDTPVSYDKFFTEVLCA